MAEQATFVGRAAEVAVLAAQWRRAAGGEFRCVLVEGEPGVGKTRFAEEVLQRYASEATALRAQARPLSRTASFGLWAEALEDHLRELDLDEVRHLCGGLLDDLACLVRTVAAARGAAPEREPPRTRLLSSLGALLANLAEKRPVVLVLDDLHLADASSWDVLHYLALHLPKIPVLVVATARPGELADQPLAVGVFLDLEQRDVLDRIPLEPLVDKALSELAEAILGGPVGKEVLDWLSERSRGIPLFAVGLLQALRDEGGVIRPGLRSLPEELTERVRVRVGLLDKAAQDVLEVLTMAGGRVELGALLRFSDRSPDELDPVLRQLIRSGLVVEQQLGRSVGYRVAHPLVQETIYEQISGVRRFALHRHVGRTLLIMGRLGEAALHFARSAETGDDEAIEVLHEALRQSEERGAYREGMQILGALVDLLPSGDVRWLEVADSLLREAEWVVDHRADTDTRTAVAALQEIDALLRDSPDLARRAAVKSRLASFMSWGTGDLRAATVAAASAVDLHDRAGQATQARLAALELAYARGLAGDIPALEDGAASVVNDAEAAGDDDAAMRAVGVVGTAAFYRGRFADAEAALRTSLELARRQGQLYRVTWSLMSLGWSLGFEGRLEDAFAAFEEAKTANPAWRDSNALELESNVRWLAGDFHGSMACAREALVGSSGGQSFRRGMSFIFSALSGTELDELTEVRRAMAAARPIYGGRHWFFASELFAHADGVFAWREGRLQEALALLQPAADRLVDMEALVFAAPVLVDLAELGSETGQPELSAGAAARLAAIARSTDRDLYRGMAQLGTAWRQIARGRHGAALEPARAAVDLLRPLGYRALAGRGLDALGRALEPDDPRASLEARREAAATFAAIGARWRRGRVLAGLRGSGRAGRRAAAEGLGPEALTARELEIARSAAQRLTAQEIADRLFISRRTVEGHLASVYTKLGVSSRAELARKLDELAV